MNFNIRTAVSFFISIADERFDSYAAYAERYMKRRNEAQLMLESADTDANIFMITMSALAKCTNLKIFPERVGSKIENHKLIIPIVEDLSTVKKEEWLDGTNPDSAITNRIINEIVQFLNIFGTEIETDCLVSTIYYVSEFDAKYDQPYRQFEVILRLGARG